MWPFYKDVLDVCGPGSGRLYRPAWDMRLAVGVGILILLALATVVGVGAWSQANPLNVSVSFLFALLGLGLAGLLLAFLLKSATVLYPDRIERRGPFGVRSMRKTDIAGYRLVRPRNWPPYMKLSSKRSDLKPLSVYVFRRDQTFDQWFADIPDLDAVDLAKSNESLLAQPALGATPAERQAQLGRLKTIAKGFSALILVIGAWVWIWPHPYALAVSLAMLAPLVMLGLAWWSKGLLALATAKTDARPNIGLGLVIGIALVTRALDAPVLDEGAAFIGGLVIAAAFIAAVVALDPKALGLKVGLIGVGLLALVWGWSSVVLVDRIADQAAPAVFPTQVLNKWVNHGRSTSWDIALAPWGPESAGSSMSVESDAYDQIQVGQEVCVGLHRGALAIRWYALMKCQGVGFAQKIAITQLPTADDMANLYPDRAQRQNISGRATFKCAIAENGALADCSIISETPAGYGFGAATLRLTKLIKVAPVAPDGQSTTRKVYQSTVVWRIP